MKNINKYLVIICLVAAGTVTSCENSLDIPQQGVQGIDDFYQTDDQAMNALADLYVQWRSTYSNFINLLNNMADDSYAGWDNMGDNGGEAHAFNSFTFDAQRTTDLYRNPAGVIRRVNTILAHVTPDTPVKKRIHAECYVMRAWAYSYLAQLFGGVPIFEEEITGANAQAPRSTVDEVWALVNKDFEKAISSGDLPSKSSVGDKENILRITKEAAQAWYGKSLLWQGKWSESATQLKAVINSGKYELMGDAQLRNKAGEPDFGFIVRAANNLSTEGLFEFNSKKDPNGNAGGEAYGGIFGGWRADKLSHRDGLFDYVPEIDYYGYGWGASSTTRKSAYDAFVEMEGSNGFRLKGCIMTIEDFQVLNISVTGVYYSSEGYWDFKYRQIQSEVVNNWVGAGLMQLFNQSNAWKPMRYAEVLLNTAEACIRSGDAASALTYINMVRERAHLSPLSAVTITDLKKEKRLELYKEGNRYIDLVRWEILGDADGITASRMLGEQGHYFPTFQGVTANLQAFTLTQYGWKERNKLLPIPQNELNANQMIEQNPGW